MAFLVEREKRKVCAFRGRDGSLCTQKQSGYFPADTDNIFCGLISWVALYGQMHKPCMDELDDSMRLSAMYALSECVYVQGCVY